MLLYFVFVSLFICFNNLTECIGEDDLDESEDDENNNCVRDDLNDARSRRALF